MQAQRFMKRMAKGQLSRQFWRKYVFEKYGVPHGYLSVSQIKGLQRQLHESVMKQMEIWAIEIKEKYKTRPTMEQIYEEVRTRLARSRGAPDGHQTSGPEQV